MSDADERELLAACRRGEPASLRRLVDRHYEPLHRFLWRLTASPETAEELTQEAFVRALERIDRFDGRARFSTWLVRIALNEALMKLRKRRTGRQVSLDELLETDDQSLKRETTDRHDDPEQRYARTELEESLRQAIAHLDEPSRAVLMLRDVENLSTRETGAMLGLSITTVKTRLRRARLDVRQKLGPQIKKSLT